MIKCSCGNKGCTTCLRIDHVGTVDVDVIISWKDGEKEHDARCSMDANSLIQLIITAKRALASLGDV